MCPATIFFLHLAHSAFLGDSDSKQSACNAGDPGLNLGWKDPLEKRMATHSSIPTWKIPWTEEPGGLQCMGSQRSRHNWATNTLRDGQVYLFSRGGIKGKAWVSSTFRSQCLESAGSQNFSQPLLSSTQLQRRKSNPTEMEVPAQDNRTSW